MESRRVSFVAHLHLALMVNVEMEESLHHLGCLLLLYNPYGYLVYMADEVLPRI